MRTKNTVTRARLIRALSTPDRSRKDDLEIIARYMGDSPVPPVWSLASIRGVFGHRVAREWAKHIRHLSPAAYRSKERRWLHPVVQTAYDFGTTPEAMKEAALQASATQAAGVDPNQAKKAELMPHVFLDEAWQLLK